MTNGKDMAYPLCAGEGSFAGGLTKREEFAKAAMQGLLTSVPIASRVTLTSVAIDAVRQADELIQALNDE